jgi:diphosphomevalonate decarboxylase
MNGDLQKKYLEEAISQIPASKGMLKSTWRSPSNIALIKYWGKKQVQIPANPSLSITLKDSFTEMSLIIRHGAAIEPGLEYYFEGKKNEAFETRITRFLQDITPYFPFITSSSVSIESRNTFPHSSGIASSASSMSALALAICSIEQQILDKTPDENFYQKASFMSRLGSGSAARSVYGGFVTWGKHEGLSRTSDEYAVPLAGKIGPAFEALCDAILIISPEKKKIASTRGHALMDHHPYAGARFQQARENITEMTEAIFGNDIESFIRITENEALGLHGLMMSSDPGFLLLKPDTLNVLSRIQQLRKQTGIFLAFTIDAGPNVHLIYPEYEREKILAFIEGDLRKFCYRGQWIDDRMGEGPVEHSGEHPG